LLPRLTLPAFALSVFASALVGQAAPPKLPLARLQAIRPVAERTQVLVLGTFHLSELGKTFQPSMVEGLLKQLETFKPDVIAVEDRSGAWIHEMELRAKATDIHPMLLDDFAQPHLDQGHEAQALLKLDMMQAALERRSKPAPIAGAAELVRHALLCLAAYERPSAILAWSRVPKNDPARAQVPAALGAQLDRAVAAPGEIPAVAVTLARRLGHGEVACVDDFEDPELIMKIFMDHKAAAATSPIYQAAQKAPFRQKDRDVKAAAVKSGDLLPYYALLNSAEHQEADVENQWGTLLRTGFQDGSDRSRVALWENRNLKIAARIRAVASRFPGKRVLVIYGAAHKPFLDAYLGVCADLRVVQPLAALKLK